MRILPTGSAGFIGFHLARKLGTFLPIVNLDNINGYYDVNLKFSRLEELGYQREAIQPGILCASSISPNQQFIQLDLCERSDLNKLFAEGDFTHVIHLAAQAGVRYSLEQPSSYVDANVAGFLNLLECCRHNRIEHLIYASTSSVYGLNKTMPFSTSHTADHPVSLYAATKKANELMAHSYSHLFDLPTTGVRFFTVYGPWGRPDMALFKFTKAILEGTPIPLYNHGILKRDFTFVDDITTALVKLVSKIPSSSSSFNPLKPDPSMSSAPYRIFNIGASRSIALMDFVQCLEQCLGKKALMEFLPMQAGDVDGTWADVEDLANEIGYRPETTINQGVTKFVSWYREYYKV